MSAARYPRDRIESVLLETRFPESWRIMPGRYLATPLGTRPADSRFCSWSGDYSVLYASPDEAVVVLMDLRGDGCARIGAPTDAVHARTHSAGRAVARAIHAEHADIEGLLYSSRLTGQDVYAVFDRGAGKLASVDTGRLEDHPELPAVLERHGIGLIA